MEKKAIFAPVGEKEVTRAIVEGFARDLIDSVESDVIIVGGGPAGLMAGRDLAAAGVKTLLIERNNWLGGGFWIGGYLMNKTTFRAPAQKVLDELGVPYEEASPGLYISDSAHACSKLIGAACDAGLRTRNMTVFEDAVVREGDRVAGAVINWMPVGALPPQITCMDPVAIECKCLIDATGHEAGVVRQLAKRGIMKSAGTTSGMWVERSEDLVVEHTCEAHPGLIVTGMAVATTFGLPRMGPTFGAMLLSGRRAAEIALEKLRGKPAGVAV